MNLKIIFDALEHRKVEFLREVKELEKFGEYEQAVIRDGLDMYLNYLQSSYKEEEAKEEKYMRRLL